MASELLTTQELADLLKVPRQTIYEWRLKGTAPRAVKIGKHLRFHRSDVEEWIEQQAEPQPIP